MKEVWRKGALSVFIDEYLGEVWVNIAKNGRVVKISPKVVEELKNGLDFALEAVDNFVDKEG